MWSWSGDDNARSGIMANVAERGGEVMVLHMQRTHGPYSNMHGPGQNCRNCNLANTDLSQTSPILFGLLQFLLTIYLSILTHCKAFERVNQEGHPVDLGRKTTRSL